VSDFVHYLDLQVMIMKIQQKLAQNIDRMGIESPNQHRKVALMEALIRLI